MDDAETVLAEEATAFTDPAAPEPELAEWERTEPELVEPAPAAQAGEGDAPDADHDEAEVGAAEALAPIGALAGTAPPVDEPVLPIEAYGYEEAAGVAEAALLPSIDEFTFDEPAAAAAELPPIDAFAYDEPAMASEEVELPSIELFAYDDAAVDAPAPVGEVEAAELVVAEAVDAEPSAPSPLVEVAASEGAHAPAAATSAEPAPAAPSAEPEVASGSPFVTETMAELYLRQGFHDEALGVYRQLLASDPYNQALSEKVRALTGDFAAVDPAAAAPLTATPTAAEQPPTTARAAASEPAAPAEPATPPTAADEIDRPAASGTGFALDELDAFVEPGAASPPEPEAELLPIEAYRYDEAPTAQRGESGASTLDALFGNAPVRDDDAAAATMLSTAVGDAPGEAAGTRGGPSGPSLDEIFRVGGVEPAPPRRVTPTAFSFDQFFTDDPPPAAPAAGTPPGAPPPARLGEESAGDLDQFNSWLENLKRK
jgi:hypothetical protein